MTPAEAARQVSDNLYCIGTPEQDRIAAAFELFADLLATCECALGQAGVPHVH